MGGFSKKLRGAAKRICTATVHNISLYNIFRGGTFKIFSSAFSIDNSKLRGCRVDIKGTNNKIIISKDCRLFGCSFRIKGNNNKIFIGEGCSLNKCSFVIENNGNEISVGNCTTVNGETELACLEGCKLSVGRDCMFSSYIFLRTGDSHSVVDSSGKRINPSKSIKIGSHVWVGQQVFIGKGASVATGSIIGACSVVTKTFGEENSVIAGNPARIVKEDVTWQREYVQ